MLRRMYDWAIDKAGSPHAEVILFLVAFAESSFLILPPDILLIVMVLAQRGKWFRYFLICVTGSVLGGMAGYLIGLGIWELVHTWFFKYLFSEAAFEKVRDLYTQYDFWVVFVAGFTPIPYKIFTIVAGVTAIDFPRFVVASVVGRGGRFILVSFLLFRFGPSIRNFIDKYFGWLTFAFAALLIGGFFAIKYVAH
jgi:membrane protein YqaA with SNARE-associated domain